MSLLNDFKTFALRGNIIDLAIGFIMGTSFGKIVTSLVNDVIMPPIGLLLGGVDFSKLEIILKNGLGEKDRVVIKYGLFINMLVDFLIVALVVFFMVKIISKLKPQTAAIITNKDCPECFMSIPINAKKCGHCTSFI